MQWNFQILDQHIAPGFSTFLVCDIPDYSEKHPDSPHWMSNHFLNTVFRAGFSGTSKALAMNLILRAQMSFASYHDARAATMIHVGGRAAGDANLKSYIRALDLWESVFLNHQIFCDLFRRITPTAPFSKGDGSKIETAYSMGNTIKHWASDIEKLELDAEFTIPMWLTNDGFVTHTHKLPFHGLGELVHEMAQVANQLQDPMAFAENQKV